MNKTEGWQYGMNVGELINKPSLSYDINHDEKYTYFRIYNHPDRSMAIKLGKEAMIKLAKELQSVLEWEKEE
jgi:hypothetical protein